jgi:hypothetical protein
MQSPQKQSKELERLFSAFPPLSNVDAEETLRRYFEAIEDFHAYDLEAAVTMYIKGAVPGFDGRFAPTPPMLANGCRQAAEMRQREAYLASFNAPRLAAPTVEKTAEQMERGRALMEAAVQRLAAMNESESAEAIAASKARWEKVNSRFHPDMSDEAIKERLMKPRWTVGNDAEDAA